MRMSESITNLATALVAFNAEVENPVKDKTAEIKSQRGAYSYNFSDLGDVTSLVRPILAKHGISATQEITNEPDRVKVTTLLLHTSGEFLELGPTEIRHGAGAGAQDIGSANTYARRYALLAALGLAPEDDDGAAAQAAAKNSRPGGPQQAHPSLIEKLRELKALAGVTDDKYSEQLEHYGVTVDTDLTQQDALTLKRAYEEYIGKKENA